MRCTVFGTGYLGATHAAGMADLGHEVIGVDVDQYVTDPERKGVYLTSVEKKMDSTVFAAIKAAMDGTFEGGVVVGTLASGGVGIAPFHDLESAVSDGLKAEIAALTQAIIDGSIDVKGGG